MVIKKILFISISVILCTSAAYFLPTILSPSPLEVSLPTSVDIPVARQDQYNWNRQLYTPLMNAARLGNIEDARALILAGASLDDLSEDVDQSTESSNLYFLQGNQDPAQPLHNTALHIAIYNTNYVSNFTIAQMLIDAGANVRIANNDGDTPIHYIMQRIQRDGQYDQSHLTQREDVVDKSGTNQLGHTGSPMEGTNALPGLSEREDLMINLIAHGADINAQNNQGYTPLHIGILDNEGQWVKLLTERYGSIVDFGVKAYPSSCKSLTRLEGAPKTNATNETCRCLTPVQLAGEFAGECTGNSNIFYYFRDNKPKILSANERDSMGMTGLMLAVIWEGTQKLKNPKYDPSQDGHANYTVDKLLQEAQDLDATVNCLRSPCDPGYDVQNTVLHIALLHQIPDMLKKVLEGAKNLKKKINPNLKNAQGDAPLHYIFKLDAVNVKDQMQRVAHNKDSRTKAIQYIMDHGGNINIQNKYGDTLLHLAVKRNDIDVVQFLLGAYNVKGLKEDQLINLSLRNQMGRDTGGPGKTALELAQDLRFIEIQELIANAAAENQKLLTEFAPAPQAENAERK